MKKLRNCLDAFGYRLCIVNTGGNHADLTDDYAAVPAEMKAVAARLGHDVLRDVTREEFTAALPALRVELGDRAIMRAMHFFAENDRVDAQKAALTAKDLDAFMDGVRASGLSSFRYLQNVYTTKNTAEQGLSLALCLTEDYMASHGIRGVCRVHGGGFAGTIQAYLPAGNAGDYASYMDGIFGEGATYILHIRRTGAVKLF